MDTEGTYGARDTRANRVPRPAAPPSAGPPPATPPPPPSAPPRPDRAPGTGRCRGVAAHPAPLQEPGVWRYGHTPAAREARRRLRPVPGGRHGDRGALRSPRRSLWRNGYIPYRLVPLKLFTPREWWYVGSAGGPRTVEGVDALTVYEAVLFGLLVYACGRLGNWRELFARHVAGRGQPFLGVATAAMAALAQLLVWQDAVPLVRPVLVLVARSRAARSSRARAS